MTQLWIPGVSVNLCFRDYAPLLEQTLYPNKKKPSQLLKTGTTLPRFPANQPQLPLNLSSRRSPRIIRKRYMQPNLPQKNLVKSGIKIEQRGTKPKRNPSRLRQMLFQRNRNLLLTILPPSSIQKLRQLSYL
jgi:hypothetical protein